MSLKPQSNNLIVPQDVLDEIMEITLARKASESREKKLKLAILKAMEEHGVKSFKSDYVDITYIEATEALSVDTKKLEEQYPEVYIECARKSKKSAYIKLTVR